MRNLVTAALVIATTACSHQADVPINPSYEVYSNYSENLPGRYALWVDGSELEGTYKVRGFGCSAHDFPADASAPFETSVVQTLGTLVESVEAVSEPISLGTVAPDGYAGMIRVMGEDMDVDLLMIPGFWTAKMEAEVEITATLVVDSPEGRLHGTTVSGDGEATAAAGSFCSGGAEAVALAGKEALESVTRRIGESLSNSARLREASASLVSAPVR